jgi:hypothetical protein
LDGAKTPDLAKSARDTSASGLAFFRSWTENDYEMFIPGHHKE